MLNHSLSSQRWALAFYHTLTSRMEPTMEMENPNDENNSNSTEMIGNNDVAEYGTSINDLAQQVKQLSDVMKIAVKNIADLKSFIVSTNSMVFGELQLTVLENQAAIKIIQDSLKLIEVAVCSTDFVSKVASDSVKEKTGEVSGVVVGEKENTAERNESNDPKGKRKCADTDVDVDLDNMAIFEHIDISDEEDEDMNKRLRQTVGHNMFQNKATLPAPPLPEIWTSTTNLRSFEGKPNAMALSNSNAKRSTSSFGTFNPITKKLFDQSPSPKQQKKRNNTSSSGKKTARGGGSSSVGKVKVYKSLLPKGISWNFPVTADMNLDLPELQIIAYVYHPDKDKQKRLVLTQGIEAFRHDFDTLSPGKRVNQKIMTLVCRRATWIQQNYHRGDVWYLPPSFADDVLLGRTIEHLVHLYYTDWMQPYPRLKFIYVPITTAEDHWYLMVISLQSGVVYHLDSFCDYEEIAPRRATLSNLCKIIQKMVASKQYGNTFLGRAVEFGEWPIEEARGIPNVGRSDNAAIWLMDWIDMDCTFTPNLHGELHENIVRVKTAAYLLLGLHNELRDHLVDQSQAFWDMIFP